MDWITENLAIGNYLEARNEELLRRKEIRSVLSLDGSQTPDHGGSLGLREVVTLPLIDGPGNDPRRFRHAVMALEHLVETHPPVLVQCLAGRSRSVVVVAAWLMLTEEMEPVEALAWVEVGLIDLCGLKAVSIDKQTNHSIVAQLQL